jgi:hypothetical protein
MSRTSQDQHDSNGRLMNGFDYDKQAWVVDGKYVRCGHPGAMDCRCFGKRFEGVTVADAADVLAQAAHVGAK